VSSLASVSLLETLSFLVLIAMMLMHSETGVSVTGAIHGMLFLWYAFLVYRDHDDLGWTKTFMVLAIFTGPVGAVIVLEKLRRDGLLART
jgi:integral membrane protein